MLYYFMYQSPFREKILAETKPYYESLNGQDFSHDIEHVYRVERLAKRIAEDEGVDLETMEAAALLFDVARDLEDKGKVADHAQAGALIAKEILIKIGFPKNKIKKVTHAILVHRKSADNPVETIEDKILQDADYLDALGAIAVMRATASGFQSMEYKRPVYIDKEYTNKEERNMSTLHYIIYMTKHPKLQPDNLHTRLGRIMAKTRFDYMKNFAQEFIDEWNGVK